jgi:hypothetical protein
MSYRRPTVGRPCPGRLLPQSNRSLMTRAPVRSVLVHLALTWVAAQVSALPVGRFSSPTTLRLARSANDPHGVAICEAAG